MVTSRNSPLQKIEDAAERERRLRAAFVALISGLLSMGFALAGGLIWEAGDDSQLLTWVNSWIAG